MTEERDCNTCKHHIQAATAMPANCRACLACSYAGIGTRLPKWEPVAVFPKLHEVPVQDAYEVTDKGLPEANEVPAGPKAALDVQVGGSHYKGMKIQPIEFCMVNELNPCQAKIVKYVTRKKGDMAKRLEDLAKAKHVIDLWMDLIKAGKVEA